MLEPSWIQKWPPFVLDDLRSLFCFRQNYKKAIQNDVRLFMANALLVALYM